MNLSPMEHPERIQAIILDIASLDEAEYKRLCDAYRGGLPVPPGLLGDSLEAEDVWTALRALLPYGWR